MESSLNSPEGTQPCFRFRYTDFRLLTSITVKHKFVLFEATKFMIFFYRSNQKRIQEPTSQMKSTDNKTTNQKFSIWLEWFSWFRLGQVCRTVNVLQPHPQTARTGLSSSCQSKLSSHISKYLLRGQYCTQMRTTDFDCLKWQKTLKWSNRAQKNWSSGVIVD